MTSFKVTVNPSMFSVDLLDTMGIARRWIRLPALKVTSEFEDAKAAKSVPSVTKCSSYLKLR